MQQHFLTIWHNNYNFTKNHTVLNKYILRPLWLQNTTCILISTSNHTRSTATYIVVPHQPPKHSIVQRWLAAVHPKPTRMENAQWIANNYLLLENAKRWAIRVTVHIWWTNALFHSGRTLVFRHYQQVTVITRSRYVESMHLFVVHEKLFVEPSLRRPSATHHLRCSHLLKA